MALAQNYCTQEEAAAHASKELSDIRQWWLDDVDTLIEKYMGYGYKGRERTTLRAGANTQLLKLPAVAAAVTSVTDDVNGLLPPTDYVLEPRGRILRRVQTGVGYPPVYRATWQAGRLYTIVFTEPPLDELPGDWHMAAVACVAHIAMFIEKYHDFGVALTASDAGQAGKVSTAASTSFPASLEEELMRKLKTLLRRPLI